jgi:hypothetical protein
MGQLDEPAAEFTLTCSHNVEGPSLMHIHRAPAGANGPVVFDLGDPASPVQATWTGMTPADIADLQAGDLYLNIHTAGRPAGEIRGQILTRTVDSVAFIADGTQTVPPSGSTATANCLADLNAAATELSVQCTHDMAQPIGAHVHVAPAGQNGPVVFTFGSAVSPLAANVPLTPLRVADFAATFLYLDIHEESTGEDDPGAYIRGQIGDPPAGATTGTIRITKVTFPPGGTGFGFSHDIPGFPGTFTLDDAATETFVDVPDGTYTVTEDDPSPGGFALTDVACDDADSTGNPSARTAVIALQAGEVVTCTFTNFQTTGADAIFVFHLSGSQEVPPVASLASGGCMGQLDSTAGELWLICTHNVSGPTLMHIHRAPAGANGPVVFDLGNPTSPVQATWTGMTPADVADLLAGNLYVNIHTSGRPAGEIRGQLLERTVDSIAFTADGTQTVPPSGATATASCLADLNDPATELSVQCTHDMAQPFEAHVHDAPAGTNGPVVFSFGSATSPFSGNVPMTPRLVADFAAIFLYLDIHEESTGEDDPGAYIRGQIGDPPASATTGTIRITKVTLPPGGTGFGFSHDIPGFPGTFTLDHGQTEVFSNIPAGTYTVTETDPLAGPGGFTLSDVTCDDTDSSGNPFARTATIALEPGELVTCTFRNFETSASSQIFVFHLSGDQEVPPVPSQASGGCMGRLDAVAGELALICTHNVIGATVMHVHRAPAGAIGPVVFDMGAPTSPVQATWTGMTPADIADLLAGQLYVNIHAGGRPDGEIRGQILERTVDAFPFVADGSQPVPPSSSLRTGLCSADLSADATVLAVSCDHNVLQPTAIHLHGAPAGDNGPLAFTFALSDPFAGNVPMSPRLVADFAAGFLYVDIHSIEVPEGEIRGQLIEGAPGAIVIPTLDEWGMILLVLALLGLAWRRLG